MNLSRLYHTLKPLKAEQWFYRAWYKLKPKLYHPPANVDIPIEQAIVFGEKKFYNTGRNSSYDPQRRTFTFLNITQEFKAEVDWDIPIHGKLWTYNLNYFDWLRDESITVDERLSTIRSFINAGELSNGREPYPISLRGINWIRFLSGHNIFNKDILAYLYKDYDRLSAFPEYHLQANHLLENGFSLFYAAHFFNDKDLYELANRILTAELEEQILPDGAHYELSPMYHCIILQRLLECLEMENLSERFRNGRLHLQMEYVAQNMLGWLRAFCFSNGSYAMFGDSVQGIALSPQQLSDYAGHLNIRPAARSLGESGYRKLQGREYELIADAGNILPSYQPGHAHADTLSFCLNHNGLPLIVDTGISTYEKNDRRQEERGTKAHNTIAVEDINSSDTWDGFRVGRRARVVISEDSKDRLSARHNGYSQTGVIHSRSFVAGDRKLEIEDRLEGLAQRAAWSYLHFHPACRVEAVNEQTFRVDNTIINIQGATGATLGNYLYCSAYNKTEPAQMLRIKVEEQSKISVEF